MKPSLIVVGLDGSCLLCNRFAQWLHRRDSHGLCRFVAQQDPLATHLFPTGMLQQPPKSVIVRIQSTDHLQPQFFDQSDAVIMLLRHLHPSSIWWPIFQTIPTALRDRLYRFVARNRYRWFGHQQTCQLLTPGWREFSSSTTR